MDYALFVLLNAVLFIRPSEIVPALATIPIYELVILGCIVTSFPRVISQLSWSSLSTNPVSFCVIGLFFAVVAADLFGRGYLGGAKDAGTEFLKLLIYYLLLVGAIRSWAR